MNSMNSPRSRKLVDYTKQPGNHRRQATKNKASATTTTKAFLSHKHHTYNALPSMVTIPANILDTTVTDGDCDIESDEPNDFLLKVPPRTNRRQEATRSDLRERFQNSPRQIHEHQSSSFKRGDSLPDSSTRSLDTTCPPSDEPIDFFLKIPPRTQHRQRSDLRERFQTSRSPSRKKTSIVQSILSESSAFRKLPSNSSNSDSFSTI